MVQVPSEGRRGRKAPVLRGALKLFEGTHDFSNFSRPEGKDATRTVDRIRSRRSGPFITVDFFARSFLWNQVRRLMGAALAVSRGDLGLHDMRSALDRPGRKADLGLASPEGLILMDIDYGLEFTREPKAAGLAARQLEKKKKQAEETLILASYLA